MLLRTQTSGVQVHTLETQEPPLYRRAPGRGYRPEPAEACHRPQVHPIEGPAKRGRATGCEPARGEEPRVHSRAAT